MLSREKRCTSSKSRNKPLENGIKEGLSKQLELPLDIDVTTLSLLVESSNQLEQPFSMLELAAQNKKTTSTDNHFVTLREQITSNPCSLRSSSIKKSVVDSTKNEKSLSPFWTKSHQEMSVNW